MDALCFFVLNEAVEVDKLLSHALILVLGSQQWELLQSRDAGS